MAYFYDVKLEGGQLARCLTMEGAVNLIASQSGLPGHEAIAAKMTIEKVWLEMFDDGFFRERT